MQLANIAALHPAVRIGRCAGQGRRRLPRLLCVCHHALAPADSQPPRLRPPFLLAPPGSYPNVAMAVGESVTAHPFKVKLQLESRDAAALRKAEAAVGEALDVFTL